MANFNILQIDKRVVALFATTFIVIGGLAYNVKSSAQSSAPAIPSSGTCALLMTLPIPYGFNVATNDRPFTTGYNVIGQITFLNSSTGKFSGRIVNPSFNTSNSPYITEGGILNLNNFDVNITALNSSSGFSGGYQFNFSGTYQTQQIGFTLTGVPANNGKTIMLVSTGSGQANNPGFGPGSGLCQV